MADKGSPIPHVRTLQPGDNVEIYRTDHVAFRAVVEECMISLNLAWIRDAKLGERKIVSPNDHLIFRR